MEMLSWILVAGFFIVSALQVVTNILNARLERLQKQYKDEIVRSNEKLLELIKSFYKEPRP